MVAPCPPCEWVGFGCVVVCCLVCSPLRFRPTQTLQGILTQLVPGKKVVEICEFGDTVIERQCALSYKSKKIEKGIAFPTCVSVNELVCHYSPLAAESIELKAGDSVKMCVAVLVCACGCVTCVNVVCGWRSDLGCHIDGFIAVVGHTAVVGAAPSEPVAITGRQADVIMATYQAAEAAVRTIKPGNTVSSGQTSSRFLVVTLTPSVVFQPQNTQVTAVINQVAEAYGVTPVTGTFSHQMKQYVVLVARNGKAARSRLGEHWLFLFLLWPGS